jgi:hypothetical protein
LNSRILSNGKGEDLMIILTGLVNRNSLFDIQLWM